MPRQQRRVTTTQTIGADPVLFTICYHHTGVKPHPFISPPPDSVERVRAAGCLGAYAYGAKDHLKKRTDAGRGLKLAIAPLSTPRRATGCSS